MSVRIINVTKYVQGREYGKGEQHYEVRINHKFITCFTHNYEDGLSVCLNKAAEAVKKEEVITK